MEWDGTERRQEFQLLYAELERHIDQRIKELLDERADVETKLINSRFDALESLLKSGFPDGDLHKHRFYHDEVIEFMRGRREMWKAIQEKTLSGLLWSSMVSVGIAFWHYVKTKIGSP